MPDESNEPTPRVPGEPMADAPDGVSTALPAVSTPLPEGWQPLPAAAGRVAAISGALSALPVAIALTIAPSVLFSTGIGGGVAIFVGALALLVSAFALLARARWRRTRWRLDGRGLQVSRGLVWHSDVLVPRSRVQHLDIERGPIERHFGLATLVVHTAGTRLHALRQAGFADADAVALRDALLPEAQRDDDPV